MEGWVFRCDALTNPVLFQGEKQNGIFGTSTCTVFEVADSDRQGADQAKVIRMQIQSCLLPMSYILWPGHCFNLPMFWATHHAAPKPLIWFTVSQLSSIHDNPSAIFCLQWLEQQQIQRGFSQKSLGQRGFTQKLLDHGMVHIVIAEVEKLSCSFTLGPPIFETVATSVSAKGRKSIIKWASIKGEQADCPRSMGQQSSSAASKSDATRFSPRLSSR